MGPFSWKIGKVSPNKLFVILRMFQNLVSLKNTEKYTSS
jgi:hypothetical protein